MVAERMERPRGSLVNKVRWPIVFSIAIALLVVGYVLINISTRAQRQAVFHIQQSTAEEIALPISTYLQDAMNDLALFAQTGDLMARERAGQQAALERLQAHKQGVYDEITLLDQDGNEIAKVSRFHTFLPAELGSQADTAAFRQARMGLDYMDKETVISPHSGLPVVGIAVPVYDPVTGDVTGVLAARVSVKRMWDVVAEVEIGERGYAYVINTTGHLLAHTDLSRHLQLQGKPIDYVAVVQKVIQVGIAEPGVEEYTGLEGERIVGAYAPIEGTSWVAIVELPTAEAYASLRQMRLSLVGLLVVAVLAIAGLASWLPQRIVRPLAQLEEGAALLSSGHLDHRIALRTGDELEALGNAFNQMATQLQELIAGLEQQVAERTRALERRALQLQAAAEVARDATAVLDVEELMRTTVERITERFGFYHAGVFLLDDAREYAVLRAASSEGGQRMLERGHKLAVGRVGIVGYVAGTGEPRIALDVGEDAVFFDNPDLPETRSEMALPLKVRGQVIGVLDVQSTEEAAFTEEDVATLQTMADQLAVAIENARLFRETQERLRELSRLYGEYSATAWAELASPERPLGYVYDRVDVVPVEKLPAPALDLALQRGEPVALIEPEEAEAALAMPLKLRDQIIGALGIQEMDEAREWSPDEVALVEAVSSQVALALENARLFEETQKSVRQVRALYETSRALSSSLDEETLIRVILEAVYRTLGSEYVLIATVDETAGTIGCRHVLWRGEFDVFPEWIQMAQYPLDHPDILADIYRTGRTEIISEWDERFNREIWDKFGHERLLRVFMPIKMRDRVIGVVEVGYDKREKVRITDDEVQMLSAFMDQAAAALENARLFAEMQAEAQRRALVNEILQAATTTLDPEDVLRQAGAVISRRLRMPSGLFLWDPETETLRPVAIHDFTGADVTPSGPFVITAEMNPVMFKAVHTRQQQVLLDAPSHVRGPIVQLVRRFEIQDVAFVPLITRDRVLGLIALGRHREQPPLNEDILSFQRIIAASLSVVVENAYLFQETQAALSETENLYEASAALNAAQTYEDILSVLREHTLVGQADRNVSLNLFDRPWIGDDMPEWSIPIARWTRLPPEAVSPRYPLRAFPSASRLLRPDAPTLIEDVENDPRLDEDARALYSRRFGAHSTIFVPLVVGGQWIGYVNAIYGQPTEFPETEVRGLMSLAGQAAIAVQSIRQLERTQEALRETEALYRASRAIVVAQTPDDVLRAFTDHVVAPQIGRCVLALIDPTTPPDNPVVEIEAAWEPGVERPAVLGNRWTVSQIPLIAKMSADLMVISDVSTSPEMDEISRHVFLNVLDIKAVAIVPLLAGERHLGWLLVESLEGPYDFSAREVRLYGALAGQAAVALESMRLFEEVQRRARRERLIREVTAKVWASTDLEGVLKTTAQELSKALGTSHALVWLGTPPQVDD